MLLQNSKLILKTTLFIKIYIKSLQVYKKYTQRLVKEEIVNTKVFN